MKQFLKDNWFKIVIAVAILIVSVAFEYYFAIYLPKEKAKKEYLANQIKCQQEGNDAYEKDVASGKESRLVIQYYSEQEFKFSTRMNTCLYKMERNTYFGNDWYSTAKIIKDVYTNKEIINWTRVWEKEKEIWKDTKSTEQEWNQKYIELFEIIPGLKKN